MKHETKTKKKSYNNVFFSEGRIDLDRGYKTIFLKILFSFIQHETNFLILK